MKKLSLLKHPFRVLFLSLAAGGVVFIVILNTRPAPPPERLTVTRGTITEEITVTGTIKPAQNIALGFTKSGRVNAVYVDAGNAIIPGQILAELDASQLTAQMNQAKAGIASAQAKRDELLKGTRPEQIALLETQLANAKQAQIDADRDLKNAVQGTLTDADDAIHNKTDVLFTNPRTAPQLIFTSNNSQLKNDVERLRANVEKDFTVWGTALASSGIALRAQASLSLDTLNQIRVYLDTLSALVNTLTTGGGLDATTISNYRSYVSGARTTVNAAIASLSAAEQGVNIASANVFVAERKLALDRAPATQEQISAAEALVAEAKANAAALQVQLDDSILRSPLKGVVTKIDIHAGEIVSPNVAVVSAISHDALEIAANVPEVDIGKIARGNPVSIVFDAFTGESFAGKVVSIDPAETIVDGVVSYKITVLLDKPDPRLKSGLTANLAIAAHVKNDVLLIPQFGILQTDEGIFVEKWINGTAVKTPVTIGVQGKDNMTEILSGVNEGDEIVNVGLKAVSGQGPSFKIHP